MVLSAFVGDIPPVKCQSSCKIVFYILYYYYIVYKIYLTDKHFKGQTGGWTCDKVTIYGKSWIYEQLSSHWLASEITTEILIVLVTRSPVELCWAKSESSISPSVCNSHTTDRKKWTKNVHQNGTTLRTISGASTITWRKNFLLTLRTISTYIHELFPCELNNFHQ